MNTISIDTQRDRAAKFSKQFETASYEMGQAQRFVTDFCEIFGIDHRRLLDFETRVKNQAANADASTLLFRACCWSK